MARVLPACLKCTEPNGMIPCQIWKQKEYKWVESAITPNSPKNFAILVDADRARWGLGSALSRYIPKGWRIRRVLCATFAGDNVTWWGFGDVCRTKIWLKIGVRWYCKINHTTEHPKGTMFGCIQLDKWKNIEYSAELSKTSSMQRMHSHCFFWGYSLYPLEPLDIPDFLTPLTPWSPLG